MRETDRERKGKKYVNDIKVKYKKKKNWSDLFSGFKSYRKIRISERLKGFEEAMPVEGC